MIRQRKYLFIGGPWDGLWRSVPHGTSAWRVPIMPTRYEAAPNSGVMDTREALYHRQRVLIPGWFVPLTVYTTDPLLAPGMGTALPGLVQGARPDMTPAGPWRYLDNDEARYGEAMHYAIRERRYRP